MLQAKNASKILSSSLQLASFWDSIAFTCKESLVTGISLYKVIFLFSFFFSVTVDI